MELDKIITSILTLATVVIGLWQFNKGQKLLKEKEIAQRDAELTRMHYQAEIETLSRFKEMQIRLYIEAASVVGYLTVNEDFTSMEYNSKLQRFWQLYWIELSVVESDGVAAKMVAIGEILEELQATDFDDLKTKKHKLKNASLKLATAIKESARSRELPKNLEEIKDRSTHKQPTT